MFRWAMFLDVSVIAPCICTPDQMSAVACNKYTEQGFECKEPAPGSRMNLGLGRFRYMVRGMRCTIISIHGWPLYVRNDEYYVPSPRQMLVAKFFRRMCIEAVTRINTVWTLLRIRHVILTTVFALLSRYIEVNF